MEIYDEQAWEQYGLQRIDIFICRNTVLLFTVYRNVIPNDDLKFKYIYGK